MTTMGTAGPAVAVPSPARGASQRRLMSLLLLGNLTLYAFYGGVVQILLPEQVKLIDEAAKVTNLGIITGIGAIFATLLNPIGGALSDRTRSRFGRRNPYILGGALLTLIFGVLMGSMTTIALIVVAWCLAQGMGNVYQAAITAVVPDRVPRERRGVASAVTGAATMLGMLVGVLVAGRFVDSIPFGYATLGALLLVAAVLMVTLTHDPRPAELPAEATRNGPTFRESMTSFMSALKTPDFRWVFIGRALIVLAYFSVLGYMLYLLEDHIGLPEGMEPADGVALLSVITTVFAVISTAVGGPLSDRLDRRKAFVFVASVGMVGALLIPLFAPTWPAMIVFVALNGLFFGVYMAVDTAMVTLVLPQQEDAGRDMGVLNIANAGPQIIAPFVAAVVIKFLGGYSSLFIVAAVLALAGALAILPVKSVR